MDEATFKTRLRGTYLLICLFTFPLLSLFAQNIREVDAGVLIRPLIISIALALILSALLQRYSKNPELSIPITAGICILFFSYGQVYDQLVKSGVLQEDAKAHLSLGIGYLLVTSLYMVWMYYSPASQKLMTGVLLWVGTFLVLFPIISSIGYYIQGVSSRQAETGNTDPSLKLLNVSMPQNPPDIYYILLDGYGRSDTLKALGYDNSEFLDDLQKEDFYIGQCSHSNYRATLLSVTSTLNMGYLWDVIPNEGVKDHNVEPLYQRLRNGSVKQQLKQLGYKVVAFETGYAWDEWKDADLFLAPPSKWTSPTAPITDFEYLYLNTTALKIAIDTQMLKPPRFMDHYERVQYVLNELKKVATVPGPKFVYTHILVPHAPYIFLPDGSINPDTNYYGTPSGVPVNDDYGAEGYINNIRFLNGQMPDVIRAIKANSKTPPIIIIQGDHSLEKKDQRYNILNAYYFPNQKYDSLYPTISPINSFRVVFNQYFGAKLPLLDDKTMDADFGRPYATTEASASNKACPAK